MKKILLILLNAILSTNSNATNLVEKDLHSGKVLFTLSDKPSEECSKVVNSQGQVLDMTCPMGPPTLVGVTYQSDDAGNWRGGQVNHCSWPGQAYSYIESKDKNDTCHVVVANSESDFADNFHGICIGSYYTVDGVTKYKNIGNVGYMMGEGIDSNQFGDSCYTYPGSSSCPSVGCSANFIENHQSCHVNIESTIEPYPVPGQFLCPTEGTGI